MEQDVPEGRSQGQMGHVLGSLRACRAADRMCHGKRSGLRAPGRSPCCLREGTALPPIGTKAASMELM